MNNFPFMYIFNWWTAYPFVFSQLSTCGHPAITDTPIIRTSAKSRSKINYRRVTEINSWYYGLSLMRTLTQDPYSIRYKVRSFRCIGLYKKIPPPRAPPPQHHPPPPPEELKVKKYIAFGRRKNVTFKPYPKHWFNKSKIIIYKNSTDMYNFLSSQVIHFSAVKSIS